MFSNVGRAHGLNACLNNIMKQHLIFFFRKRVLVQFYAISKIGLGYVLHVLQFTKNVYNIAWWDYENNFMQLIDI